MAVATLRVAAVVSRTVGAAEGTRRLPTEHPVCHPTLARRERMGGTLRRIAEVTDKMAAPQ